MPFALHVEACQWHALKVQTARLQWVSAHAELPCCAVTSLAQARCTTGYERDLQWDATTMCLFMYPWAWVYSETVLCMMRAIREKYYSMYVLYMVYIVRGQIPIKIARSTAVILHGVAVYAVSCQAQFLSIVSQLATLSSSPVAVGTRVRLADGGLSAGWGSPVATSWGCHQQTTPEVLSQLVLYRQTYYHPCPQIPQAVQILKVLSSCPPHTSACYSKSPGCKLCAQGSFHI